MSDTATTTNPLALPVSKSLFAAEDAPLIQRDKARDILFARLREAMPARGPTKILERVPAVGGVLQGAADLLGGGSSGTIEEKVRDYYAYQIAELISQGLPEEAMSDAGVSGLDLRPYMKKLATTPDIVLPNIKRKVVKRFVPDDRDADYEGRMAAGDALTLKDVVEGGIQNFTEREIALAAEDKGEPLTETEIAELSKFDDQVVQPTTAVRIGAAGMVESMGGSAEDAEKLRTGELSIEDVLGGSELDEAPTWDRDFLNQMLRTGQFGLEELSALEQENEQFYGIDVGETQRGPRGVVPSGARMNVTEALDYIHNLPESQVIKLQQQMKDAGYFDDETGVPAEGDAWDDATFTAWRRVLLDAGKQRVSVPRLLIGRASVRKTELETQRSRAQAARTQQWNDPGNDESLEAIAQSYALEHVGRRLRPSEVAQMRGYILGLKNDRLDDMTDPETGNEPPWLNPDRETMGFDETDVARNLRGQTMGEEQSMNGWDSGQKLYDAWGIDFPTTSDEDD